MSAKGEIHLAAAMLTCAAMQFVQRSRAADPQIKSDEDKQQNLDVWEHHRIFYHALVGAIDSDQWPTPKGTPGPDLAADPTKAITAILGNPATQSAIAALIAKIPELASSPSAAGGTAPAPSPIPAPKP